MAVMVPVYLKGTKHVGQKQTTKKMHPPMNANHCLTFLPQVYLLNTPDMSYQSCMFLYMCKPYTN